jgi:hypothetical protein
MVEIRVVYRFLVGKPEGKRPFGRTKRRWEDNIKTYLQEVECYGMNWIDLGQVRDRWRALVNSVMNFGFHKMRGIACLATNRIAS